MRDLFKEEKGKTSSKRVAGIVCIMSCLFFALLDQLTEYKVNLTVFNTVFFGGIACLGSTLMPKK